MNDIINVIVRYTDDGLYATSPQAPGLLYGRPTILELHKELNDVLEFHFGRPGPFRVMEHHEMHFDIEDGELVTRIAIDEHIHERQAVYERIGGVAQIADQARSLVSGPTNPVGECVYICAVATDTVEWVVQQLHGPGDAVIAAVATSENFLFTVPFTHSAEAAPQPLDLKMTMSDVMRSTPIVAPPTATRFPLAV